MYIIESREAIIISQTCKVISNLIEKEINTKMSILIDTLDQFILFLIFGPKQLHS